MPSYNPADAVMPARKILPAGTYEAVVEKAELTTSDAGNEQIKVTLTVYGGDSEQTVWDYLVFKDTVLYKVKHFCESAGIDFEKGDLRAEECLEKNVRVKLKIDPPKGQYPEKNAVADYVKRNGAAPSVPMSDNDPNMPF